MTPTVDLKAELTHHFNEAVAFRLMKFLSDRSLVIVPREPTEEMKEAGILEVVREVVGDVQPPLFRAYKAMISAV